MELKNDNDSYSENSKILKQIILRKEESDNENLYILYKRKRNTYSPECNNFNDDLDDFILQSCNIEFPYSIAKTFSGGIQDYIREDSLKKQTYVCCFILYYGQLPNDITHYKGGRDVSVFYKSDEDIKIIQECLKDIKVHPLFEINISNKIKYFYLDDQVEFYARYDNSKVI
jgi:hypothetical protein